MVHVSFYHNYGKTFKKPRHPYEKERLDAELGLGRQGLQCKRELWRVQYALSHIRKAARDLLTLDEKNPRRVFEGEALMHGMNRYGLLDESQNKLDYAWPSLLKTSLNAAFKLLYSGIAWQSLRNMLVVSSGRSISGWGGRWSSFMARTDSEKHNSFSTTSRFEVAVLERVKRKNSKAAAKKPAGGDGDEEDAD